MINGGLELHFTNIEAQETATIAMPMARYAFEFSLRANLGHFLLGDDKVVLVYCDAFDSLRLSDERDHLRWDLTLSHDE